MAFKFRLICTWILFSLTLISNHENQESKYPTKYYNFTVHVQLLQIASKIKTIAFVFIILVQQSTLSVSDICIKSRLGHKDESVHNGKHFCLFKFVFTPDLYLFTERGCDKDPKPTKFILD